MKHGDAAMLVGLGIVIIYQAASTLLLLENQVVQMLPSPAATAPAPLATTYIGVEKDIADGITKMALVPVMTGWRFTDEAGNVTTGPLGTTVFDTTATTSLLGPPDTTAPLAVPSDVTVTTGPMDRDADGYCPLDVAPLPARLDGTPTTEYALIELPKGTDQLVVEIQMLERSRQ
jgi:hypothetical protein